jgi:ketosteroid isomerase-like protein
VALLTPTARSATDLVTGLFDIVDGRRWDELVEVFTPDAVYDRPGYDPLVGLDRIVRFYERERIIATGRHSVTRVVSDLGAAACWGRFVGTGRDGRPLDEEFADTYAVRDGRIAHRKTYFYRPAI